MARYLYSELSSLIDARKRCADRMNGFVETTETQGNQAQEWFDRHEDRILCLVDEHLPSGSGFDNGTKIDLDASHAEKLVFTTAFHHMNEGGMYDGWTEHTITLTPSFSGFNMRVSGRNRNDIKEYIGETFQHALETDLTDQLEYERLEPIYHAWFTSRWLDGCTQRWDVCIPDMTQEKPAMHAKDGGCAILVKGDFKSWIDARAFAVQYMQGLEASHV